MRKDEKKTILCVVYTLKNGGTEKYLLNVLRSTYVKYNYIVAYYDGDNVFKKELDEMGVLVLKISGKNRRRVNIVRQIIKQHEVDIVYAMSFYNSLFVNLAALIAGVKKRIVHSHRSQPNRKINIIKTLPARLLIMLLSTDRLACNDGAGKALFVGRNYEVVNNGIELSKYKYNKSRRGEYRKKLAVKDPEVLIGSIGRLDNNKNQIFMIKILEVLLTKNSKYKLLLLGDGEDRERLMKYVKERSLSEHVIFGGTVDNANDYYNAMDVFLLTSFSEGLPFVLIEAQANGLPIFASSNIDSKSKLNENFKFLNLDDGAEHWANEIINVNKKRQKPSERIEEYSIEKTVARIEEIYES